MDFPANKTLFTNNPNWEVICFCVYPSRINFYGEHVEVTQFT